MFDLVVPLHDDGTWLCQHVDASDRLAAPTRLSLQQTLEEPRRAPFRGAAYLRCADCGILWGVCERLRVARPYIDWSPVRDIERIMAVVRKQLPGLVGVQYQQSFPTDDDGLWWFYLRGLESNIQLESSTGMCPFLVEHDGMKTTGEGWRARTVEAAAQAVVQHLADQTAPRQTRVLHFSESRFAVFFDSFA